MARWTVVELLHPIPSLLTTVAAVGFALIFGIGLGDVRLWWIAAVMLLVQSSISALNEWADADLDPSVLLPARLLRIRPTASSNDGDPARPPAIQPPEVGSAALYWWTDRWPTAAKFKKSGRRV